MRFSFWYYVEKLSGLLFCIGVFCVILGRTGSLLFILSSLFAGCMLLLRVVGGMVGEMVAYGKHRMRCPFCGAKGEVFVDRRNGTCLRCALCGVVKGGGFLGLRLVIDEDENEDTPQE